MEFIMYEWIKEHKFMSGIILGTFVLIVVQVVLIAQFISILGSF